MKTKCTITIPAVLFSMIMTCAMFGFCLTASALESPPERMTYQGYLVDGNGVALGDSAPANYELIFRIYTQQSAGIRKWSEQQTVTVDKGYFSVLLGEGTPVNGETSPSLSAVFTGTDASERYISITVKGIGSGGSDVEILPRLQLVASPYAYMAAKIAPGAINSASIADASIASVDIQDNSITSADIADNSITSSDILNGSILSIDIADNTISSADIQNGSVFGVDIADNSITGADIANESLTAADLAANSVGASEIAAGSVGYNQLASYLTFKQYAGVNVAYNNVSFTVRAHAEPVDWIFLCENMAGDDKFAVYGNGSGWIAGTLAQSSDRTLKENILPLKGALSGALKLKPSTYYMKDDPAQEQIGFVAQDVIDVFPQTVMTNSTTQTMGLNYSAFGVIAIGAIQELNQQVESLKTENDALLKRLDSLEARLESLEQ